MIRNGINDNVTGGWFLGGNAPSDWLFAGEAGLKFKGRKFAGRELKTGVDLYGLILDEPFGTSAPGGVYDALDTATWNRQYKVGSLKPSLRMDLGGTKSLTGTLEYAYALYRDDMRDSAREVGDFAALVGTTLQSGDSKVTFQYLSVGQHYYSPLAQTRQDAVTDTSSLGVICPSDSFGGAWRGQSFLDSIPRPGTLFTMFDRTADNVFPYGLATPNRQGVGGLIDLRPSGGKTWRLKGSAYFLKEIEGDLTFNADRSGYVPVEDPTGDVVPVRKFTYVNIGPSVNLGPSLGFAREFLLGMNARFEKTSSLLGDLNCAWWVMEAKSEVMPGWGLSVAGSIRSARGDEAGLDGSLWARYPYLFDNQDLGRYQRVHVDGRVKSLTVSNSFRLSRQGTLNLDGGWTDGDMAPSSGILGAWKRQFVEATYEIRF
jgi:hypothetical protein